MNDSKYIGLDLHHAGISGAILDSPGNLADCNNHVQYC